MKIRNSPFARFLEGAVVLAILLCGATTAVAQTSVIVFTFNALDLAYSDTSKVIYATKSDGTLTPISPLDGGLGSPVTISNLSGRICASDGGRYIFVALNGATNHICQFDVNSGTVVHAWTLDGAYADDMAPVLGSSAAVAVAHSGVVAIYDSGIARSNTVGGPTVIEPSRSPDRLYGYNNQASPAGTYLLHVDSSGVVTVGAWGALQGFGVDISCRGGWLFATTGQIFEPERGIQVGSFANTPVVDDAASGRYYFVSAGAVSGGMLTAYDQNTLLPVGAAALPGVAGSLGSFIRCGANAFALRLVGYGRMAILHTSLISAGPAADLRLSAALPSLPVASGAVLTYTLTVSNQGPSSAQNVVLTQMLPGNSSFVSATSSSGSNVVSGGGLVASLLGIPAHSAATVTINLKTLKPGLLAAVASVTSDSLDPNLTNNVLRLELPVATVPPPDSVTEMNLQTTDLVWDKVSGHIFASVPNANWLLGNSLVAFDPATGNFDPRISVGLEPATLAVADNGQYLYAGINGDATIQRINLASRVSDLKFPTGLSYPADIAVLPGSPEAVAVTAFDTLAVFDNGVMRSNTVGPNPYNIESYLAFSDTNTLVYEGLPNELRRIAIDASGARWLDSSGLISGYDRRITFGAGRLYTPGGRVIDPESHTLVTNLPYSGLACPDPQSGKVFYLTVSGSAGTLHALNSSTFAEVGTVSATNISGTISKLIRWGVDGLAFRTSASQLFLIRTTLAVPLPLFSGIARLPDGNVRLTLAGTSNLVWRVQVATNLSPPVVWLPSTNLATTNGSAQFSDLGATNSALRFYRAIWP